MDDEFESSQNSDDLFRTEHQRTDIGVKEDDDDPYANVVEVPPEKQSEKLKTF